MRIRRRSVSSVFLDPGLRTRPLLRWPRAPFNTDTGIREEVITLYLTGVETLYKAGAARLRRTGMPGDRARTSTRSSLKTRGRGGDNTRRFARLGLGSDDVSVDGRSETRTVKERGFSRWGEGVAKGISHYLETKRFSTSRYALLSYFP